MKKLFIPLAAALLFAAPTAFAKSPSAPTPKGESGAATGETGMSASKVSAQQEQAYDATYQSDIAQEKHLKSGGGSK